MTSTKFDFTFPFHSGQRDRFRNGDLIREWRHRYPQIFDDDDERVLETVHQRQYHFFEWLTAVLIFESSGYCSLVAKYTTKSHPKKRTTLGELITPTLYDWLCENESGQPDLFVFHPQSKDWYFCEVKGGNDRIRPNQIKWVADFAKALAREGMSLTGRTRVAYLKKVDSST